MINGINDSDNVLFIGLNGFAGDLRPVCGGVVTVVLMRNLITAFEHLLHFCLSRLNRIR